MSPVLCILQALQMDTISLRFLNVTEKIEDALSHIPYNKLDISEEVREQVLHLPILLIVMPNVCSALLKIFIMLVSYRLNLCMLNLKEQKERWNHQMCNW